MIETPAAVVIAAELARSSAFFSIGTNDLVQYTLAVDRGNARLADRFSTHQPAVVRQLRDVLAAGKVAGIEVSVCGEMASEPLSAVLLLGLGFRSLSVSPPAIPLVKWVIRNVPESVARAAAEAALLADRESEVSRALADAVRRHCDPRLIEAFPALPRPHPPATLRQ
jgi:phosphoenolpyruvate-protein kinase (PTS system EI component)